MGLRPMMPALLRESWLRHSSRIAVLRADRPSLTYGQLGMAVDELADRLSREGVGSYDSVLYCGDRGLAHLLTLFASWQLGAAVAFVQPHAKHRLASLRRRVEPRVVVGDSTQTPGVGLVVHEPESGRLNVRRHRRQVQDRQEKDLAYLLPTSGTTGEPKIVAVPHGALARRCAWAERAYPLSTDDVALVSSSPTFDFSVWEVVGPLSVGATIAIVPPEAEAEPEVLADFMIDHDVTVAHFVPSMLSLFLAGGGGRALVGVRLLLLGGERLAGRLCRSVREVSEARMWNQYGPTETCIDITSHEVTDDDLAALDVPIGRPIDGAEATVLDLVGQPVADGATGMLHVGGSLLAWGYLGMGGRTAAAFVPDPEGPPGARLYATGDLVRSRDDGMLTYVGRADQQVKIRGVRVEPGEVEAVLGTHPSVRDAAVVVIRDEDGPTAESHLVAHVVPERPWSEVDLRVYLAESLPHAATPSRIVTRKALPRLESGKVDRRALVAAGLPDAAEGIQPGDALTETEALVRDIWSDVLGAMAGPHSSFFELGGNSLTAMRVVTRLRRATGIHVPVQLFFTAPTLEAYAAAVDDLCAR